jgi:GNAT superfamily N-acetyltransferase
MIEFKKAGIDDVAELIHMRVEFLNEVQTSESRTGQDELYYSLKEYFIENMNADRFLAWVATDNGVIVGTSGAYFYTLPPSYKKKNGKVAYIMNMYTKPAYRGRGIAPTLFGKLIEASKEHGCSKISLHATEMGKPVYLKFGFTVSNNEMILNLP